MMNDPVNTFLIRYISMNYKIFLFLNKTALANLHCGRYLRASCFGEGPAVGDFAGAGSNFESNPPTFLAGRSQLVVSGAERNRPFFLV